MRHPVSHSAVEDFAEVLRRHARVDPDAVLYTFVDRNGASRASRTRRELDRAAQRIAAEVQAFADPGDRAVLIFPPGLDYIEALFGCFYAGVVAVPLYPPNPRRLGTGIELVENIVRDSGATVALTLGGIVDGLGTLITSATLSSLFWVATDRPRPNPREAKHLELHAGSLAMLQYTSGSTGLPKGVRLTHGNLIANQLAIREALAGVEPIAGGWLPLYHDMGLIGLVLHPCFAGTSAHLMSPIDFVRRPMAWLEMMSETQAPVSAAPTFAFDLCVERSTPSERRNLDLSRWRCAIIGAEAVRADVIERFADAFAPAGFRPESFRPCFGMAESTLLITGVRPGGRPMSVSYDAEGLAHGTVRRADGGRRLVGCGRPARGHAVRIVSPRTRRPLADGEVGEIWVSGPSVASGYWGRDSDASFGAEIDGEEGAKYLRTGDLGFFDAGELFITGRIKDTITVRGRQYYPEDLERIIDAIGSPVRRGCVAAVSWPMHGREEVAIVVEVDRTGPFDADDLTRRILLAISDEFDLPVARIALVSARTIPKTSSGKIKRSSSRELLAAEALSFVADWHRPLH